MLAEMHREAVHICGDLNPKLNKTDFVVLCTLKNAELYVQEFIDHYLKLGATHIFFLDNNSTDNTLKILKEQGDLITVLQTKIPFKNNYNTMSQFLIYRFGMKCWSLVAD